MAANAEASVPTREEGASEIDPNKLIKKNNVLGFEKPSGFEEVTNFDISVCGYVADDGLIMGHILEIKIAITDPLQENVDSSRRFYLTNRDLGNHQTITNTLSAKFKALWISQSKEPYLPQYLHRLCNSYVKGEDPRRFIPVKVVGKQPDSDVWVFNDNTQMDKYGIRIDVDDMEYIVIEDDKLPLLKRVSGDFDAGEALYNLLEAEKKLFQNNFPQVIMAHAASSIAANYGLVVKEFDGCATPILQGHPVSGKTTALKAVLSVFGQTHFSSESSAKYIENKQSQTTLPFGWDDASCMKTLKALVVNSYNACGSATLRTTYRPQTVPMVTTNMDCNDLKIKSRWLRIPFEELDPKLKGIERISAESELREAMQQSHKSLPLVTCNVHMAIAGRLEDPDFIQITEQLEAECEAMKEKVDHRAQNMFSLMLFCSKKILQSVNSINYYEDVWQKAINLVIPSYALTSSCSSEKSTLTGNATDMIGIIEKYLKEIFIQTIMTAEKEDVLEFFDQDYTPTKCLCGDCITFSVPAATSFVKQNYTSEIPPVSEAAIRAFIKHNGIGCVGNQVRFRNRAKQCHAAHIQRAWFNAEDIRALDEKLGKRSKKEKNKKGTRRPSSNVITVPSEEEGEGEGQGEAIQRCPSDDVITVPTEGEGQGQGEAIQRCASAASVVTVPSEEDREGEGEAIKRRPSSNVRTAPSEEEGQGQGEAIQSCSGDITVPAKQGGEGQWETIQRIPETAERVDNERDEQDEEDQSNIVATQNPRKKRRRVDHQALVDGLHCGILNEKRTRRKTKK